MKLSRIPFLFSGARYRRSVALFSNPLKAHVCAAMRFPRSFSVGLRSGGSVRFEREHRRFLDWALGREGVRLATADGQIQVGFDGLSLFLRHGRNDFFIFWEIVVADVYRVGSLAKIGTVVDLGANIGLFSAMVAGQAEQVFTVEPMPDNAAQARRNLAQWMPGRVEVIEAAISARFGATTRLFRAERASGCGSIDERWAREGAVAVDVPVVTLGQILERTRHGRIDLLKCDIEGAEYGLFLHTPLEQLTRIDRVVMEIHFADDDSIRNAHRMIEVFESAGLRCWTDRPIPGSIRKSEDRLLRAERTPESGPAAGKAAP